MHDDRAHTELTPLQDLCIAYRSICCILHGREDSADHLSSAQELHGARSDALGKHMDLVRVEKASLAAELAETRAMSSSLQAEIDCLQERCLAAEANADAISKVCNFLRTLRAGVPLHHAAH